VFKNKVQRRIFRPKKKQDGENYTARNFVICIGRSNKEGYGRQRMYTDKEVGNSHRILVEKP
jgi:hypothetical protein